MVWQFLAWTAGTSFFVFFCYVLRPLEYFPVTFFTVIAAAFIIFDPREWMLQSYFEAHEFLLHMPINEFLEQYFHTFVTILSALWYVPYRLGCLFFPFRSRPCLSNRSLPLAGLSIARFKPCSSQSPISSTSSVSTYPIPPMCRLLVSAPTLPHSAGAVPLATSLYKNTLYKSMAFTVSPQQAQSLFATKSTPVSMLTFYPSRRLPVQRSSHYRYWPKTQSFLQYSSRCCRQQQLSIREPCYSSANVWKGWQATTRQRASAHKLCSRSAPSRICRRWRRLRLSFVSRSRP